MFITSERAQLLVATNSEEERVFILIQDGLQLEGSIERRSGKMVQQEFTVDVNVSHRKESGREGDLSG